MIRPVYILLCLVLAGTLHSQKPKIIDFTSSDCDVKCSDKKIRDIHIDKKHSLFLNFTFDGPCSVYFVSKLVKVNADTLILDINYSNEKWSPGGAQSFALSNLPNCLCYYNFTIKISHVDVIPKVIFVDHDRYHDYFGFVDPEFYETVKDMNFSDSYESIKDVKFYEFLGLSVKCELFTETVKKLGGDYLHDEKPTGGYYDFEADNISFGYNEKSEMSSVYFYKGFKGTIIKGITMQDTFDGVVAKIGKPDITIPQKTTRYDENGKEREEIYKYRYFYNKYHLELECDLEGKIINCNFTNSIQTN